MNKRTLDKIINFIKEEMTTQSVSGKPGFSDAADDKGPVAGISPKMGFLSRKFGKKKYATAGRGSRKIWLDNLKHK